MQLRVKISIYDHEGGSGDAMEMSDCNAKQCVCSERDNDDERQSATMHQDEL